MLHFMDQAVLMLNFLVEQISKRTFRCRTKVQDVRFQGLVDGFVLPVLASRGCKTLVLHLKA